MRSITSRVRIGFLPMSSSYRLLSAAVEPPVRVTQHNKLLVLELNRPKALNSLSMEMCTEIKSLLLEKINTPTSDVAAFIVKGSGGKAFCAGGDVKAMWSELMTAGQENSIPLALVGSGKPGYLHTDFFRQEYIMNYLLGTSLKPQVSLWDGIVMGGGVGLSVLGEFRVATEKSLFAMPETAIGLFPDVGSTAWLPHLPDGYGAYIGLTGARLGPADLIHTGIATHFISSGRLAAVEAEMAQALPLDPAESRKHIKAVLDSFQAQSADIKPDPNQSALAKNQQLIERCFGESVQSVEQILSLLQEEAAKGSEFAGTALAQLAKMSPTSLKLSLALLRKGKDRDLKGCLRLEYRAMMACMRGGDFKEGIRAVLVDRDGKPVWQPATLGEVSDASIAASLESLGEHDLSVPLRLPSA